MSFFDSAYRGGPPPWDIGRPQKEFVLLVKRGEITGSVLDIGCGTGENALFFAKEGHEVWGIDSTALAIGKAKEKAAARGLQVHFLVLDALHMSELIRKFDTGRGTAKRFSTAREPAGQVPDQEKTTELFSTATDSGLFHTLPDADRPVFVENLAAVLAPGGKYFMLCFSELEPGGYGPRRITRPEIRATFRDGWTVNYIRPAVFESRTRAEGSRAWLAGITKE
ncbi:MAG TPA: class I SAM-dependent methyltransferase [Methanomicrobiales archaeon]|jgi:SAM-dependent methyltransferase|nr:class I SAM-dependent methyltransferase [Methanomicrobiales archaeon]